MAIRDRGLMKWTAFMMPEHNAMLRDLRAEEDYVAKPEVDSYLLAEIESQINFAMEYHLTVNIRTWAAGVEDVVIGEVHFVDMQRQSYVVDTDEGFKRVKFADVVGVSVEE